jgi:Fe-S-cluster-containing hydrogenase component 2
MKANYGFKDGTGDFFITIDTDKCDGCGKCVEVCTWGVMVVGENENDPLSDEPVAKVSEDHRKKIKFSCNECKPDHDRPPLPCVANCPADAIMHSW